MREGADWMRGAVKRWALGEAALLGRPVGAARGAPKRGGGIGGQVNASTHPRLRIGTAI